MSRPAVLAVDGGNSKADVALVDPDGTLLGAARGATISHQAVPLEIAAARLADLLRTVGGAAHVDPELAVLCLAGADYANDIRTLRRTFSPVVAAADVVILNDTFAALRAGARGPSGIVLICGQGINGAAVGIDGRRHRFAAVGDLSGDWGGGGSVGLAGLGAAVRARDGRGPRTELERTIPAAVGRARPEAVTRAYYDGRLDAARIGDLAPVVFATAADGDRVARSIVDRLADELATMATALARRAHLVGRSPDVVLAGGVFRTSEDGFHQRLAERIAATIPGATLVRLVEPPVLGAVLIGLDRLAGGSAAPEVEARARAALHDWNATAGVVTSS